MRTRTLRLTKETLTALGTDELTSVAGGGTTLGDMCAACRYTYCLDCVNDWTFEFCPTPTLPIENCI